MIEVALSELTSPAGRRAGTASSLSVFSVTKHAGFVPSLEYFKKQVFSRNTAGYKIVDQGNFAYATIHLDEGSIGIAPEQGLISPMYTVFAIDESKVAASYLIRFLKSPRALALYPMLGKGAIHRRKAISLAALGALPIPLPPLPEQRRIAAILDHADALRAKRRQVLAHLDTLTQSIFHDMFGSQSHPLVSARELMPNMRNGLSPAKGGKYPAEVLTLSAVTRGTFDATATKAGMFALAPPDDKRVTADDFMMCRGNGNKSLVGAGVYSSADRHDLVFPDTVIAGRVDASKTTLPFLSAAWKQRAIRSQIESIARTTNGTYKINQQTLSSVSLPLPPLDRQFAFGEAVASIDRRRAFAGPALLAHDQLFTSLQSRAFRGEL